MCSTSLLHTLKMLFSLFVVCVFTIIMVPLDEQKLLILMEPNLSLFSFFLFLSLPEDPFFFHYF